MFYSAMTMSAAKQISLFTTGSHLRDKSLNVGFGGRREVERGSIYVPLRRRGEGKGGSGGVGGVIMPL